MELRDKAGQLPLVPGVYLYKDAGGRVIYVGKAKSLRNRVRSYFSEDKLADVKTGTLIAEARVPWSARPSRGSWRCRFRNAALRETRACGSWSRPAVGKPANRPTCR